MPHPAHRLTVALLLTVAGLATVVPPQRAVGDGLPGYWSCRDGAWVASGRPEHPKPLARCPAEAGPVIRSEAACEAEGGSWRAIGIFPQKLCVLPTVDGGRFCADDGECEGRCVAGLTEHEKDRVLRSQPVPSAGLCTDAVPTLGCLAVVEQGFVNRILCLD